MYGLSGFAEKLNFSNSENSTGNCVHYWCTTCLHLQKYWLTKTAEIQREIVYNICTECLDLQKNWTSKTAEIRQEIVYIIFVQNVWIFWKINYLELCKFNGKLCTLNVRNVRICREIEHPELRKINKKFCTLYLHGISGFAEKLNVQTMENKREIVYIICTEWLDLQRNWISRIVKIQRAIMYIICTECLVWQINWLSRIS